MDNQPTDKIQETLAINTGNMIASLNLQIAKLQVAHKQLEEENDRLRLEIAKLRNNGKVVKMNEPSDNHTTNKQKH